MHVLCGWATYEDAAGLKPRTAESLEKYAPQADVLDFTGDDYAYWNAISERWTGEEDLVIIEQDNVITQETLPSFEACNELWCSFGYTANPIAGRVTACLGCTKFSAELQRQFPIECFEGPIKWDSIDFWVGRHLYTVGHLEPHDHGDVEHLHEGYSPIIKLGEIQDSFDANGVYASNEFGCFSPPLLNDLGNLQIFGSPVEKYFTMLIKGE